MKMVNQKYDRRLIFCWVFIFLFFIIYNLASKIGLIPKILGGFYTFSIVVSSLIVWRVFVYHIIRIFGAIANKSTDIADVVSWLFLIFIILFSTCVGVGYFNRADLDIVEPLGAAAFRFFCLFVICIYLPIESNDFGRINFIAFLLTSIFLFLFYILGGNEFVVFDLSADSNLDLELNYQGVALAYLLIAVFGIAWVKQTVLRLFCWMISFGVLFLIDARSEFVAALIIFLGIELIFAKNKIKNLLYFVYLSFIFVLLFLIAYTYGYDFNLSGRMGGLLHVSSDESMLARYYLSDVGFRTIQDHFILGDFASYPPGQYMHNIFSAWVDLGLGGFLLLVVIFIMIVAVIIKSKNTGKRSVVWMLCISCIVLMIFAKAYFYILLPIVIGMFVNVHSKINRY